VSRDLRNRLDALDPAERARIDDALGVDPELAGDLRPVLDGRYGEQTEQLFLRHFAARLAGAATPRAALLPALTDALREAERDAQG
jgi:hypothetical protein